jgi:deazaflavin-dependent oxidoreductase (nitroreductase family)
VIWRGRARIRVYAAGVGLVQAIGYEIPRPKAAQRAVWVIASSPPGAWLLARSLPHIDKAVLAASGGKLTAAGLLAGIPVLTVTSVGARSGLRRTHPLLGVPFGDDIAIIGTHFGQPGTPGWYYNLRVNPGAEVSFRDRSVRASAREATDDERQIIWERARNIYAGYEVYARRIKDRKIQIMVLSA